MPREACCSPTTSKLPNSRNSRRVVSFAHLFGNARRGSLRGAGAYNADFSLIKDFKVTETWNLQFRAEAFNLFNHPQFGTPANTVDVAGFSGEVTSAGRARELQPALKLTF